MKTCTKCGETKPLEEFHKDKGKCDGLRSRCKACISERMRAYYKANRETDLERNRAFRQANREAIAEQQRAYREANRETVLERKRAYYEANRGAVLERWRAYREANRETVLEQKRAYYEANRETVLERNRAYYEANRETLAERNRAWREVNPEACRANRQRRRARKLATLVDPFTPADLAAHYEREYPGGGCAYCPGPYEHDDHIVPLSRGGAHALENLAPACARCNLSKGAKTLPEWLGLLAV